MKVIYIFNLSLIFFLLIHCTTERQSDHPSIQQDKDAITAVSSARAEAFNNGNAAEIAAHFTEDAVLMAPGQPATKGRDSVRSYYQSIFDEYETELESSYQEIMVEGDLAYGRGFAKVTLFPKEGGDPRVSTSKYLNILQRQPDGTWKTTHDIWNGNETGQ